MEVLYIASCCREELINDYFTNLLQTFEVPVTFEHALIVNGTVDGIDLSKAAEEFYELQEYINTKLEELFARQSNQTDDQHYLRNGIDGISFISLELYLLGDGRIHNQARSIY